MNKNSEDLKIIPYTATSLSVVGRFIFMFLLYKNKSTNSLSLIFCVLSIFSSAMWIYYSVQSNDTPMIVRSSIEISLLSLSATYIIRNKVRQYYDTLRILPSWKHGEPCSCSCSPQLVLIRETYGVAAAIRCSRWLGFSTTVIQPRHFFHIVENCRAHWLLLFAIRYRFRCFRR